jgi:Domain of unknown function (DUF4386)
MSNQGLTLRQGALVVVIGSVVTTFATPIAEFIIWPSLVNPDSIELTIANIRANEGLFLAASFAYLSGFVGDVLIAWALYFLLRPVNQPLAVLTAGLRVVQAVIAIGAVVHLFTAYRLLQTDALSALGDNQLQAQVLVLLRSFGYEWGIALLIFGVHLGLLGYLVYRSRYIPRLVGVALAIAGVGYVVYHLRPYLYPDAQVGFVFAAFFGEVVFLVWLAIWGWRIPEPVTESAGAAR